MRRLALSFACWAWCLALMLATLAAAAEWPQWRGPHRDGISNGFKPPAVWPTQLSQVWEVEVGVGHASPLVSGGRVYQFARRGEEEVICCLKLADGKQIWQQSYAAEFVVPPVAATHGKGPKSTPVVAGGRVFTFGISGILSCWDAKTGKPRWQKDFSKQYEKAVPAYGLAMSPVVEDEKCIVFAGGPDKGALMALDVKNGDTLWSCTEDGPGYSSPIVTTLAGVKQVVTQSQKFCLGVDFDDGKLLWKIPFQTEYDQNSVTPVAYEGSLIFSGLNKGVERYSVDKQDDEWETDNTWENKEVSLYMSSPVIHGHTLFGFSHRQKGQLFALDLTTGKTLWTSDGRLGENAALVATGNVVWALTTDGELLAFKAADKQFSQLARYHVADTPTWAHPVILADGVLVKDENKLTLWQFAKP